MIINSLELHNVFSYESLYIDFNTTDFAIFVGKTGSGKTAIFDGLSWVLYDKTARKSYNKKKVLRDVPRKQTFCEGIVNITADDGVDYIIHRRYEGSDVTLSLFRGMADISHRTPTLVQDQINDLLGVDHETFINIVYYSQGDMGRFLISDSAKRIEIISNLLKIDTYDKAVKVCNSRINQQEKEIENMLGRITLLTEQIEEVDLRQLQKRKRNAQSALTVVLDKIVELSQWVNNAEKKSKVEEKVSNKKKEYDRQLENSREMLGEKKSQIKGLTSKKRQLIRLQDDKKKCGNVRELLKINSEKYDEASGKAQKYKDKMIKYPVKIKSHQDTIDALLLLIQGKSKVKECPTCAYPIDVRSIKNMKFIISKLKKEQVDFRRIADSHQKIYSTYNRKAELLEQDGDKMEPMKEVLITMEAKEQSLKESIEDGEGEEKRFVELKSKEQKKLSKIRGEYTELKADLKYYKKYDTSLLVGKNSELDKQDDIRKNVEKEISQAKFIQSETNKKIKNLAILRDEAEEKQVEYKMVVKWRLAFPIIKLNMINSVVPFIQNETNKNLSSMLKGKRIVFNVEPDKSNNKLAVIIEDYEHHVNRPFEGWSGGQKQEMSLSVFMALNKLASMRSGKKLPFLILDEKFSSIDSESRNAVIELLKEQQGANRKVWVISHVEHMDVHFNQVFKATMTDGVSELVRIK